MGKKLNKLKRIWSDASEQELIQALACHNEGAFEEFIVRYRHYQQHLCNRICSGNTENSNDLYSLVILHIYTEISFKLSQIRHLGGWLRQVTKSKFIDQQGWLNAENMRLQLHHKETDHQKNRPASPECQALGEELLTQIQKVLLTLPPNLHAVAYYRFVEEMPFKEIAQKLNIKDELARKRAQQARDLLQPALQTYMNINIQGNYASNNESPDCLASEQYEYDIYAPAFFDTLA
ncbi:RNA polymerase sigma factor [Iodobacter fluviatilis]|uniref:RNA polymerase sigma factor n=1 Tax=Iodobacter fluviatilis TaxID=537 RepID=A0A377Q7X9_9NEIS|nr:sigma-70 family RNA polymerase sigma factor [Iodobacter fluviatilis]TCU89299.1 RNA polymerase sigma factor (sigma-70 family) [Iodobacter fluviatilis]STQ90669.1 RNA polymerase sigma factor [Iodobacter fluviatilis]